jgi:hypothetical protein
MAAIETTTGITLIQCSTVLCSHTGPAGDSSSGPQGGAGDCYHSGRVSICSTASGSTDQLCSVLVSQQLAGMGQEGHQKVGVLFLDQFCATADAGWSFLLLQLNHVYTHTFR